MILNTSKILRTQNNVPTQFINETLIILVDLKFYKNVKTEFI